MIDVRIVGGKGKDSTLSESHVHPFETAGGHKHHGQVTLSHPFLNLSPELHPFLNDSFGTAMNQDVSFGGTPEIIHNGGTSTEWTGSGSSTFNFASGGKVVMTSGNNNDFATFAEETPTTVDWAGFTAFTGKIDLDTYDFNNNDLTIQWDNAGAIVGDELNLNDFIDTGDFAEQSFVIPKSIFNFPSTIVDGFTITCVRTGGAKPTVKFDDLQMEQTGEPLTFKATTSVDTRFHITEIRIRIEDALTAVLTDGSMPNIDPGAILGVSSLANGIVFQRVEDGKTLFSFTLKNLGDFFATGSNAIDITGNGTNQGLTLVMEFPEPIILKGGSENNFLSFTLNDDMRNLTRLTAAARGALEI